VWKQWTCVVESVFGELVAVCGRVARQVGWPEPQQFVGHLVALLVGGPDWA
jgi:hypothetical protein